MDVGMGNEIKFNDAEAHGNRGLELHRKGQLEEAVSCYQKALRINPNLAGVYNNMGAGLQGLGRMEEALSSFEMAVKIRPDYVEAFNNMGNLLQQMGRIDEAVSCYQEVLELKPNLSEAHNNLGNAYLRRGQIAEAISCYQKALELKPDNAQAYCNLGNVYQVQGRIDQAIFCYEKAVKLSPDNPEAYNNMGAALKHCGRLEESVSCHRKALELAPGSAVAHNNLGSAYKHQGRLPEAISCYRKSCHLKRDYAEARSNLIFAMQYDQASGPEEIFHESLAWWKQHGTANKREFVHNRQPDSKRRLRIGYVSPDFREHSVSYFFLPLLTDHDRHEVEVFCYSEVKRADEVTARIKTLSDHWRSTVGLTSDAVARRIYEDGIDILVDLAGHTANNRLLVFAHRPAPVQVTWLGFPGTTGMEVMDYRLTDEITDPSGDADKYHSEALIRLPHGFLCYSPPEVAPEVSDLPSIDKKRSTFGSFNNLPKVNERVVEIWSRILLQVPDSSLLLKSRQLVDEPTRRRYMDLFIKNGVDCERIEMLPATSSISEHLDLYNRVDIGLDPFPYNGTTTTCEALWMGVPVVTLRGDRHSSRVGASILTRVGLRDLIAVNEVEYVSRAAGLASDLDRLKELRAGMRRRMMESPLCNSKSFACSVENAYRGIWKAYISPGREITNDIFPKSNIMESQADIAMEMEKAVNYHRSGQLERAGEIYSAVLDIVPSHPDALHLSGLVAHGAGKTGTAINLIGKAIRSSPEIPSYYSSLGDLFKSQGNLDGAIPCYRQALKLNPNDIDLHSKLGNISKDQGKLEEAGLHYQKALDLRPDLAGPYYNMANVLKDQGRMQDAVSLYRKAIELNPDYAEAHNNMGNAYKMHYHLKEAITCYQKALSLNPAYSQAYDNMGVAFQDQGRIREAISCYKKALQLDPGFVKAHSDFLFCMHYDPACRPLAHFDEAVKWWQRHAVSKAGKFIFSHRTGQHGRLRIGYVSPDFREHSVSYFFLPLLLAHDRNEVEVFCYADVRRPDGMTARISKLADHYRSIVGLTDDHVAEQIHKDRIDILIDLAGHTGNNRLLVFARKPAPVQVTWLGYPDTTGLPVMDYRLTDEIADPEGKSEKYHSETLVRMKNGFLCYAPPDGAPDISSLPALQTGHITFGSFNNLPKVNEKVIEIWSNILNQVPYSSLLLKSKQFADESTKQHYMNLFLQNQIAPDRIRMLSRTESVLEHLALYNRVDIGLDPFPYNGTTTTCEALWMGVPVVTLRGDRHSSRVGASILTRVGLRELITASGDEYVAGAVALARDLDRLRELRAGMRERMMESPLCDSISFARSVEDVYRQINRKGPVCNDQ